MTKPRNLKTRKKKDEKASKSSTEDKQKKYDDKIPDWKKLAPKDGESTTKNVDGKTYHYCKKCRCGKGMWVLHKESDHTDNYANKSKGNKKDKKKVSWSTETSTDSDYEPAIQVNKSLLNNAKAYLAQYQDFHNGGTRRS
jgi:hypothetical protein